MLCATFSLTGHRIQKKFKGLLLTNKAYWTASKSLVNVTLSNSKQTLPPRPIPLYGLIDYTAKWIKLLKKPQKTIISWFLYCFIISSAFRHALDIMKQYKNQQQFSQLQFLQHMTWKVNIFISFISEKFFDQTFLDRNDLSKMQVYVLVYLSPGHGRWKYIKGHFRS